MAVADELNEHHVGLGLTAQGSCGEKLELNAHRIGHGLTIQDNVTGRERFDC